jgi:hypothetical protein
MQVGQINSASDSSDILNSLIEKLEVGLQERMKSDGNCSCKVAKRRIMMFTLFHLRGAG